MKDNSAKIFVLFFILIISTPLVLVNLNIKTDPINENEKKISMNFKRNFPLKADLFKIYSSLKTNIFNTNPIHQKAIDTKNGWKFLGNNFSNVLSEAKGLIVFSKDELESLKKTLLKRQAWFDERHIKYYIAIAPNKHSVYGDMIPIKKHQRKTKTQQLDSLCKSINVNFIDLGSRFPDKNEYRLYHKTDSHWNDYAGLFAFQSTLETISKDFKAVTFKPFTLDDMNVEVINEPIGDLNSMLQLKKSEDFIYLRFKDSAKALPQEKSLAVPFGYNKNPDFYESRTKNTINDLKIIILNDSFFGYFSKYFGENFGETLYIWTYKYDGKLIESEKPDILYHELVERDIDLLLEN